MGGCAQGPTLHSRLVVAVRATDPVIRVSQILLGDLDGAVVGREDQILFEHQGSESPAGREPQTVA